MLKSFVASYFIFLRVFSVSFSYRAMPGSMFAPTKGEIWPKPHFEQKSDIIFAYRPSNFQIVILQYTCDILRTAINRNFITLKELMFIKNSNIIRTKHYRNITINKRYLIKMHINLTSECEDLPYFGMDESYNLTIKEVSLITSDSIWGILRGLESFIQLFYLPDDFSDVLIKGTKVIDFPKYKHRGLLIDTARHFIRVKTIHKIIDGMAINKMNVLHWHIVDDQSFPFESTIFPNLSKKGAFALSLVYTPSDINSIVDFARYRGIRVIPEFDVPGHTRAWGEGKPILLTECRDLEQVLGPINPIRNVTYKILKAFFEEISNRFPDRFIHIGGDEVDFSCWESNLAIQNYMMEHRMTINEIFAQFINKTFALLPQKFTPIVWQEVFDNKALSKKTFVQVWKPHWIKEMIQLLYAGHYVIFSSTWYLDSTDSWQNFYVNDPRRMVYEFTNNEQGLEYIVGGEACMWSERVDDDNALSSIFPRTAAVAERLWTGYDYTNPPTKSLSMDVVNRIEEHWCRMKRRGIPTQPPTGPGFCLIREKRKHYHA